jgi:hypothetical protein
MNNQEKSSAFSNGEFEKIYEYIADNAIWTVVEEDVFAGKNAIIANCKQVSSYFKSVTTKFNCLNIISEEKKVVINGTAEFLKEGIRISFVSACDVYEFNDNNQFEKITSYCIQQKMPGIGKEI